MARLQATTCCLLARWQGQCPIFQAAAPSRPSNLTVARGEEGDCASECLQGVSGGATTGCGAWPSSASAAAGGAPADAQGSLGGTRSRHTGALLGAFVFQRSLKT
jgi:hypothetical protein